MMVGGGGVGGRGVEGGRKKSKTIRERTYSRLEGQEDLSEKAIFKNKEEQPLEGRVRCR